MPNWGAEIPVTIVDGKPDFLGDDDLCAICQGDVWFDHNKPRDWWWHSGITKIKLLVDHSHYTNDKPMEYPLHILIEAARRLNEYKKSGLYWNVAGDAKSETMQAMCKLLVETGFTAPVDNRVIAMRHAWLATICPTVGYEKAVVKGDHDCIVINALAAFDAKLAELEGGK